MAKKIQDEKGNTYVQKKPFYKRVWFWLVVIILVIAVGSQMGGSKSKSTSSSSSNTSSTTTSGITKAQWENVKVSETDGDTVDSVKKAFGKANSTSTSTIENIQVDLYTWSKVANGSLGANVTASFENGHAVSKSITGLKVNRSKKISLSDYSSIANGQTKDEIQTKFGKPNGYIISDIAGVSSETWTYTSGLKGSTGATFSVIFTNGSVSSMSQSNME